MSKECEWYAAPDEHNAISFIFIYTLINEPFIAVIKF